MPITAPYNFVPLSKKVFFPDWAGQVSHDIPFEDGISGEIVCKLTTQTPVYVRNGGNWERNDYLTNPETQSFFNVNGQVMIPGTSLKGMLRNVIEIATFGKMSRVDDHRYSVRDLNNKDKSVYVDWMTYTISKHPGLYESNVEAGWLSQKEDGSWQIQPCDYARVDHSDLVAFRVSKALPLADIKQKQRAMEKYQKWGDGNLNISFDPVSGDYNHSCGKLRYVKATRLGSGKKSGALVFTGQPADNAASASLSNLPASVNRNQLEKRTDKFVSYMEGRLCCKNKMTATDKQRLLELSKDSAYALAVKDLFNNSDPTRKETSVTLGRLDSAFADSISASTQGRVYYKCGELTCRGILTDDQRTLLLSLSTDPTYRAAVSTLHLNSRQKNKEKTKHMEFVFYESNSPTSPIPVIKEQRDDFIFIHSEPNGDPNKEWKFWLSDPNGDPKKELAHSLNKLPNNRKVPVFYLMKDNALHSFGLAQMYKLPYAHTIHDIVKNTSPKHFCDEKPDFAETIFGFVSQKKSGLALKGRISVTHAVGRNCIPDTPEQPKYTVLGAPKPTYYPSYLVQPDPTTKYHTMMDPNPKAQIKDTPQVRGWKRYPARQLAVVEDPLPKPPENAEKVATSFIPLKSGSFTFSIKVHNLKPEELGALIWALEWGGNENLCHSLGMGKPFGYGLVKIKINRDKSFFRQVLAKEFKVVTKKVAELATTVSDAFLECMKTITADWHETPQIFQLLAMADPESLGSVAEQTKRLRTMTIDRKEFATGKNRCQVLLPHKIYNGVSDEIRFADSATEKAPVQEETVITPVSPPADTAALLKLAERYKKR